MSRETRNQAARWVAFTLAAAALFLGAVPLLRANKGTNGGQDNPPVYLNIDPDPVLRDVQSGTSYAPVVDRIAPSVVQIQTTVRPRSSPGVPGFEDPIFEWFFGRPRPGQGPRGTPPSMPRQSGMGSGVVVTADGYLLTNNHVIENADEIRAVFADGRELTARVIGRDPKTDVAVLKVDADSLPHAVVADSDQIAVGDVVLAIGNPFGVGQTVTQGIISAKGRGLGIISEGYEDFIQTDASINPGNSGGALVDMQGRLIGINTAIVSRSGGNQGIGFAIPANLAREIMEALVADGRVTRGFLGVGIQNLNPQLASKLNLKNASGAIVTQVHRNSPAEKAGVRSGDVIIGFNDKEVRDVRQLRLEVARTRPGRSVPITVLRDGKPRQLEVTVHEQDSQADTPLGKVPDPTDEGTLVGVGVTDLDPRSRREWNIPADIQGALITSVAPNTASAEAGLRPGDVLLEINQVPVKGAAHAIELTASTEDPITLVKLWSQGNVRFLVVDESNR